MNLPIRDQLREWQKKNPMKRKPHRQKLQNRCEEHLSESDIKSLMGINQTIMKRKKGGAWTNVR
jgi:hypothetical protein